MKKVRFPRTWTWGSIPTEVFESNLSTYAKILIGAITKHAFDDEECWPGQPRLAKLCSCSVNRIAEATKELEQSGWLEVERRGGKSSLYRFVSKNDPPTTDGGGNDTAAPDGADPPTRSGTTAPPDGDEVYKTSRPNEVDKTPESPSDYQVVVKEWCDNWKAHFKESYPFNGRDGKAVKEIIAQWKGPKVLAYIKAAFVELKSAKPEWWAKNATATLSGFRSSIPYIVQKVSNTKNVETEGYGKGESYGGDES